MGKTPKRRPTGPKHRPHVAGIRIMNRVGVFWLHERLRPDGRLTIGRTRQREIVVRGDRLVSRRHCEIEYLGGGQFMLRDLGSINPVEVSYRSGLDGWRPVSEVVLELGLYIRLGQSILVPVDARGACPITVWHDRDMAAKGATVYGSAREASRHLGRSRQWIRDVVQAMRGGTR